MHSPPFGWFSSVSMAEVALSGISIGDFEPEAVNQAGAAREIATLWKVNSAVFRVGHFPHPMQASTTAKRAEQNAEAPANHSWVDTKESRKQMEVFDHIFH